MLVVDPGNFEALAGLTPVNFDGCTSCELKRYSAQPRALHGEVKRVGKTVHGFRFAGLNRNSNRQHSRNAGLFSCEGHCFSSLTVTAEARTQSHHPENTGTSCGKHSFQLDTCRYRGGRHEALPWKLATHAAGKGIKLRRRRTLRGRPCKGPIKSDLLLSST